jgi:hypothetical protein
LILLLVLLVLLRGLFRRWRRWRLWVLRLICRDERWGWHVVARLLRHDRRSTKHERSSEEPNHERQ